jgi:3-oxoadipate enol-lactonase
MKITIKTQSNKEEQTINYLDVGTPGAPVIVFIHGFPFNLSMWSEQVESLKEHFRVIAYDVRGHGNSDIGNEEFSIELFAQDLIYILDVLKIDKATVCGLSMGGYIALSAVTIFPNRFEGLILCDTTCKADTPEGKEKRMKTISSVEKLGREEYANEIINKLVSSSSITTKKSEVEQIKNWITDTPVQTIVKTLHALAERKETCSKLSNIKIPVLIVVGELDEITPVSDAKHMHELINGSRLEVIEKAGHVSNIENPEVFNSVVVEFLKRV